MGDDTTSMHPGPTRSRRSESDDGARGQSKPSVKLKRFWDAMTQMYGTRWTTNYGQTPSELWTLGIDSLTQAELKTAYRSLLVNGSAHPPTLPEFMALAQVDSKAKKSRFPEPGTAAWLEERRAVMAAIAKQSAERGMTWTEAQREASRNALREVEDPRPRETFSHAEMAAGRWFMYHAVRMRFVGMTRTQVLYLRARCIEALEMLLPFLREGDPDVTHGDVAAKLEQIAEEIYPGANAKAWLAEQAA